MLLGRFLVFTLGLIAMAPADASLRCLQVISLFEQGKKLQIKEVRSKVAKRAAKKSQLSEKEFSEIFDRVVKDQASTATYRVEHKNETPVADADQFLRLAHSTLPDLSPRNSSDCITITELRRIESVNESGIKKRSAKIRVRAYRKIPESESGMSSYDIMASQGPVEYVAFFDHPPGEIPVRFEFKIDAVDPKTGNLLPGVVEKPAIFCTKSQTDHLLNPKSYKDNKVKIAKEIKAHRKRDTLVNRPEDVDSMIEAIGKIHGHKLPLQYPHEASFYRRNAFASNNDLQITSDREIRFHEFNRDDKEFDTFDFPEDSRVLEFKVPIHIMQELRRIHELSDENRERTLEASPYKNEYFLWRSFEKLPTVEGSHRDAGKGSRGRRALSPKENP